MCKENIHFFGKIIEDHDPCWGGGNTHLGGRGLEVSNVLFRDLFRSALWFFDLGKSIVQYTTFV